MELEKFPLHNRSLLISASFTSNKLCLSGFLLVVIAGVINKVSTLLQNDVTGFYKGMVVL